MNTIDILYEELERIHNEPDPSMLVPEDIEKLIDYHRRNREGGLKPKKETGTVAKVDISGLIAKPTTGKVYRR
jgi:hypothetical protein